MRIEDVNAYQVLEKREIKELRSMAYLCRHKKTDAKVVLMENEVNQNENKIGDLLEVLKKCWWLMLIVCIIGSASMYAYSKVTYKEEYTASISIWAMKNIGTDSNVGTNELTIATYIVNDYKEQLVLILKLLMMSMV